MRVFQVRHGATGAVLWTGPAAGEIQAIDAMAHAAGYYDHSDLPDSIRGGGLSVEALFGASPVADGGRMSQGSRSGQIRDRSRPSPAGADRIVARSF